MSSSAPHKPWVNRWQDQQNDKDALNEVSQKVDALYTEVRDSDLDQNLKRTIMDGLHAIRTAIHDYTVRGAEGLQEALSTAIGQYMIFNVYVNAQMQHGSVSRLTYSRGTIDFSSCVAFVMLVLARLELAHHQQKVLSPSRNWNHPKREIKRPLQLLQVPPCAPWEWSTQSGQSLLQIADSRAAY